MGDDRWLIAWSKFNERVTIGQRRTLQLERPALF